MNQTATQTEITSQHNDLCYELGQANHDKKPENWLFLIPTTDFRTFEYQIPCEETGSVICKIQSNTAELIEGKDAFLIFMN